MNSFLYFFKHGFFHILDWKDYNHILFLTVLIAGYKLSDWKKLLWIITFFTLGHALMLLLSLYNIINVNNHFIKVLIPFAILTIAVYNIFTAGKTTKNNKFNIYFLFSFLFGMIYGLGFSNVFEKILIKSNNKFISLLEFSLGVETSQAVVVLIVLILAIIFQTIFRFNKRDWILIISSIVIGFVIPILIK